MAINSYMFFQSKHSSMHTEGFRPRVENNFTPRQLELIKLLKKAFQELGHTPSNKEMNKLKGYPSATTFRNQFGSWNKALEAAGLVVKKEQKFYSQKELIDYLQKAAVELGHSPFINEMDELKGYPSSSAFVYQFGSWNEALKAAGLKVNRIKEYSREELITYLQKAVKELGRTPSGDEMNKLNGYPSVTAFTNQFGSWNEAIEAAGLKKFGYTEDQLINYLQKAAKELGHTPSTIEMGKLKGYPSLDPI